METRKPLSASASRAPAALVCQRLGRAGGGWHGSAPGSEEGAEFPFPSPPCCAWASLLAGAGAELVAQGLYSE